MSGEESSTSRADPEELFELDTVIGHGAAGRVYKAIEKQTKKTVAIKILPVVEDDEQAYNKLMLEISMMEQCSSPNIVSFQGSYMKDNDLWIVMEFCDGGSLFGMMSKMGEGLNEKQISVVMYDMLQGLQYLHSRRMIHRDIKADNVLLTLDGVAKLADLGVAASLSNTMESRNTATGTPYWMAPELIQERPYNFGVDIWSLGITAIECADKKPPFFDMPPMRALFVIAKFGDPNDLTPSPSVAQGDKWSDTFKDFISLCLTKDVQLRPTAEQLLQHPFVKNGDKDRAELKAHVERFLVVQAEKRAEKEQRKELYRKKNPRSARDMMQKLADLDASKSVTKVNIVKLYPMGYDCFLEKERTPWSSTPIGGLQFETHILANFANEERVTLVQTEKLLRLMKDPKRGLDIKTRTYRMRKHKECFVAAEAIIWFTQKLGLSSVEEALAIGECLVHRGLIYHVLRNEPFSDSKTSFFKFAEESEIDDQEQLYAGKITIMVEMMRWGLEIKDRKWRHKTYLLCFLGCDAVDWVIKTLGMESREEAQELCQTLMDRSVFHHVSFDETFIDKPVPYRFTQDDKKYAPVSSFSRTQAFSKANSILEKMELRDEQPSSSSSATPSNSKSSNR